MLFIINRLILTRNSIIIVLLVFTSFIVSAQKNSQPIKIIDYPSFEYEGLIKTIDKNQAIAIIKGTDFNTSVRYLITVKDRVMTLPIASDDSSFLKNILEKEKWKNINYGRGNHENGPRFSAMEFYKNGVYCFVFKKYCFKNKIDSALILTEEFQFSLLAK